MSNYFLLGGHIKLNELYVCVFVFVCGCVFVCVFICVWVLVCVYVYVFCMCMGVYVCVWGGRSVSFCLQLQAFQLLFSNQLFLCTPIPGNPQMMVYVCILLKPCLSFFPPCLSIEFCFWYLPMAIIYLHIISSYTANLCICYLLDLPNTYANNIQSYKHPLISLCFFSPEW